MTVQPWPDQLSPPDPEHIQQLLVRFWQELEKLPDLVIQSEHLLAEESTATMRSMVLQMMLALNGIRRPANTRHLNIYLGKSQRVTLEKTLVIATPSSETWIGRAVALVVIYRWYAPQLVAKYQVEYPQQLEDKVWSRLHEKLPTWPSQVTTD